ncbi:MAG TPA: tetratricopeptide repeat protein [Candidatus Saccharimonadales bacterium]|nr:tetratricopeptide repeat protein [Candidatus Saccharimonadales bacterium]
MLFTDIEGSTTAVQALGIDRWESVLEVHGRIVRDALAQHGGTEVRTEGDAFFAVFTSPTEAVAAAASAQRALAAATWPHGAALRVRMGLHTGETRPASAAAGADYVGLEVHRAARIAAAGHGGQVLVSDTTAALVRDDLPAGVALRDLGEHRFKDLSRPRRIYGLVIDGLADAYPPLRSLDATPNNLPTQPTSFIGREKELALAHTLLAKSPLVTLTGQGGTGKTRLALHLAADSLHDYPGGAWLVELASVTDPAAVGPAVAAALRIGERPAVAITDAIAESLRDQRLLLVLDNCEHLIAACAALVTTLLRTCPQLKILATSREALSVPGESLLSLPSLSVPADEPLPPVEELHTYEAVRLFVDRSLAQLPDFALTTENAVHVVQICRRLDGIPLALELAAARVRSLSVAEIAQRLDDRFRLLTGGGRTVVARQQTLRALIDWSYDLLGESERQLFRRLAVFLRGWTLEAAEAVCAGEGLEAAVILDLLAHLVDKSLVVMQDRPAGGRYAMLESVREYAREKLIDSGEMKRLRQRHVEYFFHIVVDAPQWNVGNSAAMRAADDYENMRAALEWIETEPDGSDRELLLAGSMFGPAVAHGRIAELRRSVTRALARSDPSARTIGRARALLAAGLLAGMQGDGTGDTSRIVEEAVGLLRELGEKRELAYALLMRSRGAFMDQAAADRALGEARALLEETGEVWGQAFLPFILGDAAIERGDYAAARREHAESLDRFREMGDLLYASNSLLSLGRLACLDGAHDRARALVGEALAIRRGRSGDTRWSVALALNSLGEVERCAGDPPAGVAAIEEALRYGRELGDDALVSWSLHNLGHVALHRGDLRTAAARFRESIAIRRRPGPSPNFAAGLAGLAAVGVRAGAFVDAARLHGAVAAMLDTSHAVLPPADDQVRRADLAAIHAALDPQAEVAAFDSGRAATSPEIDRMAAAIAIAIAAEH